MSVYYTIFCESLGNNVSDALGKKGGEGWKARDKGQGG